MSAVPNYIGTSYNQIFPDFYENTTKPKMLFVEFAAGYLGRCHKSKNYKSNYNHVLRHVQLFCIEKGITELYTNSIDLEFMEDFVFYLKNSCTLMKNTIKGMIEKITALLNKAALYGYPINNTFREEKVEEEETNSVYLSEDEILKIYFYDYLTRKQKEVRDYFILGCLTGLRYSDYTRLNKSHFINNNQIIKIKTKKTGTVVFIPVDKYIIEIMNKYEWELPKARCAQYFNKAIKNICKKVGFDEDILWERTVGNQVVSMTKKKWEMISSHTGRRSFATNMYKKEFSTLEIMMITGHRSENAFFKYIRYSREQNAISMLNHPHFRRNG
jgi:integrase